MTFVGITAAPGRARLRLSASQLTGKVLSVGPDHARIGLVATTALLLGGDDVEIEVDVGPGARLELVELAGVVAYHGRGRPASWTVRARVQEGGHLRWHGEPFVVSDGADVTRSTTIELAGQATARLRETLVLGRVGEHGGRLVSDLSVHLVGPDHRVPLLMERLVVAGDRPQLGVLGGAGVLPHRVLDTVLVLGARAAPGGDDEPPGTRFELDGPGTVLRWSGQELAASTMTAAWSRELSDLEAASSAPARQPMARPPSGDGHRLSGATGTLDR